MEQETDITAEEELEQNLEALREWAESHATSITARFDDQALAAETLLQLFNSDMIGHPA